MIVHRSEPILLVGAGTLPDEGWKAARCLAPHVVAVDGGLAHVVARGVRPLAVIGDMDSQDMAETHLPAPCIHKIDEQDSTDFDKALRNVEAPLVLAVGFEGPRVDHQLATYSALMARAERPCIMIGQSDLVVLAPPRITLDLPEGMRLSLYPMAPVRGQGTGLKWPIDDIAFDPQGRIGTSNEVVGQSGVTLSFDAPHMLLILPGAALPRLASALLDPRGSARPSRWSVRAAR